MFDFLKNKISNFLNKITKKEEVKQPLEEQKQTVKKEEQKDKKGKEDFKKEEEEKLQKNQLKQSGEELEKLQKITYKEQRELKPKVGLIKQITTIFDNKIKIEKKDVEELLLELEISLIESDVAYSVSKKIVEDLEKKLVGKEVQKNELEKKIKEDIKQTLLEILIPPNNKSFYQRIEELTAVGSPPFKILFVGPNGAGKTTTIAKIADMLTKKGYKVVISASDTFRAAAIEQIEEHCNRIGVKLIKSKYGTDPAAVAFDAIKFAQSNKYDFVLIDTAGRQNTNLNLIDELKKIVRVSKPDIKIYVGESIAGNATIEQVQTFNNAIGVDLAILTKLDCDPKGGAALSLTYSTKVPIAFFGIGQGYSDLKEFDPNWLIDKLLPN